MTPARTAVLTLLACTSIGLLGCTTEEPPVDSRTDTMSTTAGPSTGSLQERTPSQEAAPLHEMAPAGPQTTGVPTGASLSPTGTITVNQPGTTLQGVLVEGDLTIEADDVDIVEVRVEGMLLVLGSRVTVERSAAAAVSVSGATHVTIRQTEVFGLGGADGIHITSDRAPVSDVLIEDCWIHSPQVTPSSHYDGIQVRGVDGLVVRGTTIDLGPPEPEHNAAVFLEEANGGNRDVLLEDNWFAGGGYTLYLAGAGVTVRHNFLSRTAAFGPIFPSAAMDGLVSEDNRWVDGETVRLHP